MNRPLRTALLVSLLLLAGLAAAPAVSAGDPCYHGYTIPAATTASTNAVSMAPCAFVPTNVRVAVGSTVTFTNASGDVHLLTGANQAWGDREKEIPPGASLSVAFDAPGVYAFSCALHRGMSGAVIVGGADEDAAAAGAGQTSAGGAAAGGQDLGLLAPIAFIALTMLALGGWAAALLQRRRVVAVSIDRTPAS